MNENNYVEEPVIPGDDLDVRLSEETDDEDEIFTVPDHVKNPIRRFLYGRKYLGFCFLAPFLIMLLVYVAMGVWPVSDESVLVLDLNAQYVYFLEKLRDIILGEGSLLYTFERSMGGEFMGIFAYYLASPFNLLTALFPKEYITEALLLIITLKCGFCGLTFGIFLNETRERRRPVANIIFSVMYALSAFAVVMQHNFMWTDNLICLPLIMLGIDRMIKYGKFKTYVIFLALAVFSNFYIGYMTCLFVAFYFFVRYFSMTPEERNPRGIRLAFPRALGRTVFFSLIAVMMAAVVILTAYYSLSFGKLEFSEPDYSPKQLFDITELLSKLYFGTYDTVRPEGAPFLYAGMMMTVLMPLYFVTPGIPARKKVGAGVLMALFFVSFNLSTADLIWHGFQRPNWLNARFAFMFVMIGLLMAYEVFVRIKDLGYRKVVVSGAVSVLLLVLLQTLELENMPTFKSVWASVGLIGLYLLVMRFTYKGAAKASLRLSSVVLLLVVCVELFLSGVASLYALDDDVIFSSRKSYRDFIDPYLNATELVSDSGFYRTEKTDHRKTNDNLTLGFRGLSNSTSTLNKSTIDFLNSMGLTSKSHWSKYVGGTVISDIFFGIKYLYIDLDEGTVPWYVEQYYEKIGETEDRIRVYKNPYALPIAFTAGSTLNPYALSNKTFTNPFDKMDAVISAVLGTENTGIWDKIVYTNSTYAGCRQFGVQDNHMGYEKNEGASTATVTYTLTAPDTDHIYMYITSKWPRKSTLKVNGRNMGTYFTNDTHGIIDIGSFKAGEEVKVEFALGEEKFYVQNGDDYFFSFNSAEFNAVKDRFTAQDIGLNVTSHDEDRLEGTVSVPEGGKMYLTTIPYDEGWHITCDGEELDYGKSLDSLISFVLPEGEHEIELYYLPESYVMGMAISISGVVLFAICCTVSFLLKKRRLKKAATSAVAENSRAIKKPKTNAENKKAKLISKAKDFAGGVMNKIALKAGKRHGNSAKKPRNGEKDGESK